MTDSDIPDFKPMTPPPGPGEDGPRAGDVVRVPPVGTAPPTYRPHYERPQESAWPRVIGIICIVFGSLGSLGGFCGALASLLQGVFSSWATQAGQPQAMADAAARYTPYLVVANILTLGVAVVLLVGGIGLVKRRRWSRMALLHWSWMKMLVAVVGGVLGYLVQQAQFEAMQNDPDISGQMPAMFGSIMRTFGGVGLVLQITWFWALPVFTLVWFNRRPIRHEVSQWS